MGVSFGTGLDALCLCPGQKLAVSQVKQGTLFVYGLGRRIYNCYVLITQFGWYGRGIYPVICSIETLSVVSNPQLRF